MNKHTRKHIQVTKTINAQTGQVIGEEHKTIYVPEEITAEGWRWPKSRRPCINSFAVEGLTWADRGRLAVLATLVDRGNRVPDKKKLADEWGLSERRTYDLLNAFTHVGAIARIGDGLYLNPAISMTCYRLDPVMWRVFRDSLVTIVPRTAAYRLDLALEELEEGALPDPTGGHTQGGGGG